MNTFQSAPIPFPPIARHGVIGDRRTGALVAADGTIDWLCAPDFDDTPVFGALLDPARGGFCRFGPREVALGQQRYAEGTATLLTSWVNPGGKNGVELADVMAWPGHERSQEQRGQRLVIRWLRASADTEVRWELRPRRDCREDPRAVHLAEQGGRFVFHDGALGWWSSFATETDAHSASRTFHLRAGEEAWAVLGWNLSPEEWSISRAASILVDAETHWREWSDTLKVEHAGERDQALRRCALTVQLLSHVDHSSAVAALTTSLPERLGGDRNYDYRYAWVRDASLSLSLLARLGKTHEVGCYLDWLTSLVSTTDAPLQVCYRLDGNPHLEQDEVDGVRGYRDSLPVFKGNHAATQRQLGSMGFFVDCVRLYLDQGGEWRESFWHLLKRVADYTCDHWQEKGNGVWELAEVAHYVSGRVMSWVILERAVYIAQKTGHATETDHWREIAAVIHADVMDQGWCSLKNSFRQKYGSDALDASVLLIPLMGFLPPEHPRVVGTLAAIRRELVVDGLVHRFDPTDTLGGQQLPIGEFEGAFLPCVFWYAHALAKAGRCDEAEAILRQCESVAGEVGVFAEEICAREHTFLGNTPLLFSQVEYARAVMELNAARERASQAPPSPNL